MSFSCQRLPQTLECAFNVHLGILNKAEAVPFEINEGDIVVGGRILFQNFSYEGCADAGGMNKSD